MTWIPGTQFSVCPSPQICSQLKLSIDSLLGASAAGATLMPDPKPPERLACHVRPARPQPTAAVHEPVEERSSVAFDGDIQVRRPAPHAAPVGDGLACG